MRKILLILLCFIMGLSGCAEKTVAPESEKLQVVVTVFPLYDFVRAVGGDVVDCKMLLDPGTEVHNFDPAPSDIRAIYNADSFFYIGGESEEWVQSLLGEINLIPIRLMDCVPTIAEDAEHTDHSHAGHHHAADEHIWTSPTNALLMLEKITETLAEADPKNTTVFYENSARYAEQIKAVRSELREITDAQSEPFLLVADRFPFRYFAEEFSIEYAAAFGGCAISTDISLKTMTRLVKTVEQRQINAAFYAEMSSCNIADALAEETGVKLFELHSAHTVTPEQFKSGITYVDLMRNNAQALREGWAS